MIENELKGKKAAFLSLGCKVNSYETESIKEQFKSYGCIVTSFNEPADIYVINTCTVTNIADRKSRQMIHKAKSMNNSAIVVATGCYVQESADKLKEDYSVDILVGNRLKKRIAGFVNKYIADCREDKMVIVDENLDEYEDMSFLSDYQRTRVDIKIQDGCNQFCSYCIIPYARGRICSRNSKEVINEVKNLAERGYKEVVLTGIHISSYGFDNRTPSEIAVLRTNDGCMPLVELIEKLNDIDGLERIRIGSVEPRIVTEEFAERLSKCSKFCPHFHLSLQSGSNTVLKRMNRKYTTEQYFECVEVLRDYFYKPSFTTDIITGFPGETSEEFKETCEFAEKCRFAAIHIFPYSVREGTKAASMLDQIDGSVKQRRASELSEIEKQLRDEYEKDFEGDICQVLVEECFSEDGITYCTGHTREYVQTYFKGSEELINTLVDVTMSGVKTKHGILSEV